MKTKWGKDEVVADEKGPFIVCEVQKNHPKNHQCLGGFLITNIV